MDDHDESSFSPRRRAFLKAAGGAGAGLALAGQGSQRAAAQDATAQLERNKAVALRFKKAQGTKEMPQVEKEVLAPNYRRLRGGMFHLASNARDQGHPSTGAYLRGAFPDRVDVIEQVIAEGDKVGLLFRLTGTHSGNLFGIPPTGRKVDVYEIAILRLAQEKIVEGWFMADEAGLLKQLGARLPPRKDGQVIAPEVADVGEEGDVVLKRLMEKPPATQAERNKIVVARSKSSTPAKGDRAPDFKQRRPGFQNMRVYGDANGVGHERLAGALPDRRDTVHDLIAEGDKVWMHFQVRGTQTVRLYGLPPTGRRISVPEVGIATFAGGKWQEGWYFADELGALLQLGVPNLLVS